MARKDLTAHTKVAVAERYELTPNASWTEYPCHWCGTIGRAAWTRTGSQKLGHVTLWALQWDHVIPLARGGADEADNIVWACPPCNQSRNARLPGEWRPKAAA